MNNETKKGGVPRLRFPEFRGEWTESRVGNALTFQTGFPFNSSGFNDEGMGVRLIRNRDLKADDRIAYYSKPFDEKFKVNNGDVLIGMDGDFTPFVWNKGQALLNQRVGRILIKEPNDLGFFLYFLTIHLKAVEEATARTTVKHLSHSDVEKLSAPIPSPAEQQKIADCLSSLDETIGAEGEKWAALKAHKRGLMQGLFPQEGESVPRLRFAGFEGEWEEGTLKDACQMQAGKFVSASNIVERNGEGLYPCYGGNGLRGYTATFTHEGKYPLIGRQGALCGNVNLATERFHATEHAIVVTPRERVNTDWLYYKLILLNLNQYATGQAQPGLSVENLEKVKVMVPSTEAEQQKIADTLSSLDALIAAQAQRIAALKAHKRGLMQGLFPSASGDVGNKSTGVRPGYFPKS